MFGSYRNGITSPFAGPSADDFWGDLEVSRKVHVRQAVKLGVVIAVLVVLSIVIHPSLLVFAGMLSILFVVELVVIRSTRPTGRVPRR